MKKVVWIVCFLAFVIPAMGQKASLGLKVSPGLSWLKPDTKGIASDGSKLGFSYGAIVDLLFTENYGVGSGLFISHLGGKLESSFIDTSGGTSVINLNYKLHYLQIPLTLKMRTNEIGYFRYFGQFGVMPGINLGAKGFVESLGTKTDLDDAKKNISSFHMSLVLGAGTMYSFSGNTSLLLGIEWNNGFTDILKGDDAKAKLNFLMLNAGVIF